MVDRAMRVVPHSDFSLRNNLGFIDIEMRY